MEFRIITWNARGGVISDQHKRQNLTDMVYKSIQDNMGLPIFFIQEAGTTYVKNLFLGGYKYRYYISKPYDARNNRCTLAIIYPEETVGFVRPYWLRTRQTNRPLAAILIGESFLIATIHATAVSAVAKRDVVAALEYLKNGRYLSLLLGDMNCEPGDYNQSDDFSSFSMVCPNCNTHDSGSCYDYLFAENNANVYVEYAGIGNNAFSDHFPVYYNVNVAFL